MSVMSGFGVVLKRDLHLAFRNRGDLINPLVFFMLVATLFPLGVGPDPETLMIMGGGVIWVSALLSNLLAMDSLFRSDFEDGSLEQLMLAPQPLWMTAMAKVISHWLVTGLPLTLLSPVLAIMFGLPSEALPAIVATLFLGTPLLSLIGAIGAGLTVGLRKGGILLSLLTLPLYIPVLILGTGAIDAAVSGMAWHGHLLWQGVLLVLGITFAPLAISASLRISVSG
ncbi:heme exporter protein CcmB [Sansalvadorimonas verongulae]|uniref:heme exporter protein CcmB n=1 Tax=Sansalvadorimonas verongulae TaxID=2172824 RepID=UPI0012BC9AAC|nr:heme exporter protein CcmB [Sansalvadorimonas verongulae]MTI13791.1 heme exporter protein CcmB [Sansalvadorimonas verongulae]